MPGRVEKRYPLTIVIDMFSANMVCNSSKFALDDVGVSNRVEQRGLAVVNMAHYRHDRWTRLEMLKLLFGVLYLFRHGAQNRRRFGHDFGFLFVDLKPELVGDQ